MKITDAGVPVDTLIGVIKEAVKHANVSRTSAATDLRVASVQLILEVVASKSTGGGVNFRVPFIGMQLSAGTTVTAKDTHTIDITLVPPDTPTRVVRGGNIDEALTQAITTIRGVIAEAATGDDPWVLQESTVDISFAITKTGTITLGVEGELSSGLTQTLRLGLAPGSR